MSKLLSIVTSMYNRKPEVLEVTDKLLFPSLVRNGDPKTQLIIIDDFSPLEKETRAMVSRHLPSLVRAFGDVVFIRNHYNQGFAQSFNSGIIRAEGQRVIVANDDLYFPEGSIAGLDKTLDGPEKFLVAGPVTNASSAWSFQYCRQAPHITSYEPAEIEKLERFATWLSEKMKGRTEVNNNLCGFCFVADKEILRAMGGFDERYRYGSYEDTDLIQRIARAFGQERIAINPEVFVGHGGPKGSSQSMLQHPWKMFAALLANGARYGHSWGYWTLLKRVAWGFRSQFTGRGTISELLPEHWEG